MDPASPLARRFPLIPRPRPPCTPLAARIAAISELAGTAARTADLAAASAAFNQAALLASDCGQPALARHWCHRHARAYLRACPLPPPCARRALEPLVNLARLHIRDSNGDAAFRLLDSLYHAVTSRTATTIDGIALPANNLTQTPQDHHDLRQWLWTVHLSDSPRALISAGCWQEALTHLHRHNGIGQRMLDGRQVAVITHCTTGDTSTALTLLDQTAPGEPWEHTVTACLTALCRQHASLPASPSLTDMLDSYQQLPPAPRLAVFRTRLGLSVIDAAQGVQHPRARAIARSLIDQAARDGYAAREILAHPGCTAITTSDQAATLTQLLKHCALGHQNPPADLEASLSPALDTSEEVISCALPADARNPSGHLIGK
jgi:hypothetical protein